MKVREFLLAIGKEWEQLFWYEKAIYTLFILRCIHISAMDSSIPAFKEDNPEYTYYVLWHYLCSGMIELAVCYSILRRVLPTKLFYLSLGAVFIGVGYIIDQFSYAAISWLPGQLIWIIVVVVYIYIIWKRTYRNE